MLLAERFPQMLTVSALAKEFGVFGLIFAPASLYTYATTDASQISGEWWFVVAKVVFINIIVPGAFAMWRVLRSRQQRDASAEAIDSLVILVEQLTPYIPPHMQPDVERAVLRIQRTLNDKESSRRIKDLLRYARRRRRR